MSEIPHEHDENGNCIIPENDLYPGGIATWRFSLWDIVGILITGLGGMFIVAGQASNLLSRECAAMANYSRREHELREAQREYDADRTAMADQLRDLVERDGS